MPTKRAPDAGDSAHIPSSFTRLIIFLAGRLRRPRPSAGNASRWALAQITERTCFLMKKYQFWCPKCRKGFHENEVEKREVDTMFGEGRWWFCQTCDSSVVLYANQDLDLHSIFLALGDRAMNSVWQVSGVDCFGEKAEELCLIDDNKQSVSGNDLLPITAGITQTIDGYFRAFDKVSTSHWFYMRAWDGRGFYVETNDHKIKERLDIRFQNVEDVAEAQPPYQGLFIPRGE